MKRIKRVTISAALLLLVLVLVAAPAIAADAEIKCNPDTMVCEKESQAATGGDGIITQQFGKTISGVKFDDTNGNKQLDPGEPGLEGWTIKLTETIGGPVIATTTTDRNGMYIFRDLSYRTYIVWEVLKDGWIQTWPGIGVTPETTWGWIVQPIDRETGWDFGNFKLGEISGMKFEDTNGNKQQDAGEPGLSGWTITLTGFDEITQRPVSKTAVTDSKGNYKITGLTKGKYTLKETLQPGWIQTYPVVSKTGDSPWSATIYNSGDVVPNMNFGNFRLGEINGMKFEDKNGNKLKDAGEPGLKGWTITLTGFDELTGEQVTKTAVTDDNGNYKITGLTKGKYTLKETLKDGWIQTYPSVSETGDATWQSTIFTSGQGAIDINFGNFKLGEVNGRKFEDVNGNSKEDPEDKGLQGWTITLTGLDELTGKQVTKTAVTDLNGNYKFTGLTKGTYTLKETLQPGWIQTHPGVSEDGSKVKTAIISGSSQIHIGYDFGNFKLGEIDGQKWEDLNANGKIDSFEDRLSGWTIKIEGTDTITGKYVSRTAITSADGIYAFPGLTAGTYTVTEVLKDGWVQTYPAGGKYTIYITSGKVAIAHFGNFHKGEIIGGGYIPIPINGKGAFDIWGRYLYNQPKGTMSYTDDLKKMTVQSKEIKTVATTLNKRKGVITGIATVNGQGAYPFEVYVEDNTGLLEPAGDVFKISLPTYPYSKGDALGNGDIKILK